MSRRKAAARWALAALLLAGSPCCGLRAQEQAPATDAQSTPQTGLTATSEAIQVRDPGFQHAREVADAVLRQPEFQRNLSLSWWQQKRQQLQEMVFGLFDRVNRIGHAAPWLVRALEWVFFVAAAAGLAWFVVRRLRRHRLRVAQSNEGAKPEIWTREASDWAQRAEAFAANEAWRDAVHCLYWAAIVLSESRRAWRHNPTRTPREYVRLLKAGSAQQQNLRGLTQLLEHSWYGLRETDAGAFTRAKSFYDGLSAPGSGSAHPANGAGLALLGTEGR